MVADYYTLGELLPDLDDSRLEHEESRRLLAACQQHPAFDIVELRRLEKGRHDPVGLIHDPADQFGNAGRIVDHCGNPILDLVSECPPRRSVVQKVCAGSR